MKKIVSLLSILFAFTSCSEEVKFSNPSFQAYRDGVFFNAIDFKAYRSSNGALSIVALAQDEEVEIKIANQVAGTYYFGTTNLNTLASYSSSFGDVNLEYETRVINGPVATMESQMNSAGSGYTSDCTLQSGTYVCGNSHATTGGSGSGLTLSVITNSNGAVTSVKVASPGFGYKAGDLISITGGNNNAKVRVLNIEGSNGQVVITENTGDTVSGTFKFNAINLGNQGEALVNFQYGNFYKIPIFAAP